MPDPKGTNARRATEIHFTPTVSMPKADLDRAIGGGIKRGGGGGASHQEREELFSTVYFRLTRHFAKGGELKGSLGSLAFKIAEFAAIDASRRHGQYARRCENVEVADATPAVEVSTRIETGEGRVMLMAEAERRGCLLRAALGRISAADRDALIEMLERDTALPRGTAQEIRVANAAAQREKRARDRLVRAVRAGGRAL